jgi:hypothetical protein
MAAFLYGTELNLELENMIIRADNYLLFVSPYIKLHERIKDELKRKKNNDRLEITILFGKNEDDPHKSINIDDVNFLKEFPNISICYKNNLHAKYYASEDFSLITSMNLHQFSHNNNIEIGVKMEPKKVISKLTNFVTDKADIGESASGYFDDLIEDSKVIFRKIPQYQSSGLLGMSQKYTGSFIEVDKISEFFTSKNSGNIGSPKKKELVKIVKANEPQAGYCIRTGVQISFNLQKPFCYEAYNKWAQFSNPDYPEKYCHLTGKPSNGKTSKRNPVL